jgi:hypothetical protein
MVAHQSTPIRPRRSPLVGAPSSSLGVTAISLTHQYLPPKPVPISTGAQSIWTRYSFRLIDTEQVDSIARPNLWCFGVSVWSSECREFGNGGAVCAGKGGDDESTQYGPVAPDVALTILEAAHHQLRDVAQPQVDVRPG